MRLPLQVDFDAIVVTSTVPAIVLLPNGPLPTIHVTIKQDLGAALLVESLTITNQAGTVTYYAFDPSNSSIAPRTFVSSALP